MRNFFGVGKKKKDQGERIAQSIGRLLEPSQSIARSLSYECSHPFRRNLECCEHRCRARRCLQRSESRV